MRMKAKILIFEVSKIEKFHGYNGKIAHVNLTTNDVNIKDLNARDAKEYIGGTGLSAKLLHDLLNEQDYETLKTDPFNESNPLIFATGPITATARPSSGRYSVCAISPLTGIWGESTSGGQFPAALKMSGFDAIIITGKSDTPRFIFIKDKTIQLKDASNLWGLNTYETQEKIQDLEGDQRIKTACIGKAGENLVKYACIINDEGRAAGRTGMGAIMGSKKLKALSIIGSAKIPVADRTELLAITKQSRKIIRKSFSSNFFAQFGTLCYLDIGQIFGDTPSYYFTDTDFLSSHLTGRALKAEYPVINAHCTGCTIGCGRTTFMVHEGKEIKIDGPEYETVVAYGPLVGIEDMRSILESNQLSNEEAIDTISAGVSIAFLIYLVKQKIGIDSIRKHLSDIKIEEIDWNQPELLKKLLNKIINKEGIGKLLSQGVREMAKKLGVDPELAAHVKGLEIPMHDPRAYHGQALSYMTSCVGANHNKADYFNVDNDAVSFPTLRIKQKNRFEMKRKEKLVALMQDVRAIDDSAITCNFINVQFPLTIQFFNAITGFQYDKKSLIACGERINNLKRVINCKMGMSREDDKLPAIVCKALKSGATRGISLDLQDSLKKYYKARKWDWETGLPSSEKLKELRIDDA